MTQADYHVFREVTWLLMDYVAAVDPDEKKPPRVREVIKNAEWLLERHEERAKRRGTTP